METSLQSNAVSHLLGANLESALRRVVISKIFYSLSALEIVKMNLKHISGLILGLRPANERRRYFVTTSLIGLAQA